MDESVISGAQLFYPTQFGINSQITGRDRDSWLEGLVNGAPYLMYVATHAISLVSAHK